jgi:hypothetical protein
LKIYINDIPVSIVRTDDLPEKKQFDKVIDGTQKINRKHLIDDVLINNAEPYKVDD